MTTSRATRRSLLFLSGLLFAPVWPAAGEERLVLPGVASVAGAAGARFVSTVWASNPSDSPTTSQFGLVTASGVASSISIALAPRETRRIADPVETLFGLSQTAGTLTVRSDGPIALRGVTANVADPVGTYGLALTALRESEALLPGETGLAPWLTHTAATGTGFRTNVAVTLLEAGSEVRVSVVDDTGLVRAEELLSGGPLFWQRSVGDLSPDPEIPLGRLEMTVVRGSAVAYTAVVDNVTGDGILAMTRRDDGAAPYALMLDGAARASGANGTSWRTGLRLANRTLVPVAVTIEPVGVAAASASATVPPRGLLEIPDLLGSLGAPEGSAGAARITSSGPLTLLASTRNSDPSGRPGTFAASQEGVPAAGFLGAGRVVLFPGLSADADGTGFRTNVAFLGGAAGGSATLLLRSAAGTRLAEAPVVVAPSGWVQKPIAEWFGGISVPPDSTLELGVTSGTLDSYASVIDNGTGDPVVLRPIAVASGSCPPSSVPPLLTTSIASVTAGGGLSLTLAAPGRAPGRVVPGDLPLGDGGSVSISPGVTTTYRWLPAAGCGEDVSGPVTVAVTALGSAVMTEEGAVRGVASAGATSFKGIPFAAPPAGPLRFRPPAPAAAWNGVRDASAFGSICSQLDDAGAVTGSEACLFLNVWTPSSSPASPLPVLFFIHGGGNAAGASSYPYYDGTAWASKGRAVVVTVNYRLSSFGWLAQPSLAAESRRGVSGNYGLLDLLSALRWTRRNIAAFGGDPSRVTIFGESAGGVNVCSLVASPLAKGLFAGALEESGGCGQRPLSDFVAFGNTIVEKAGCAHAADGAACLRGLTAEQLLLAVPPQVSITSSSGQLWGPAVDGFVLPDSPDAALAKGTHNRVPFVLGANADETGSATAPITSEAEYRAAVTAQFGALAPLILAQYPAAAYPTPRKALVAVTTDARFVCPSRRFARAAAAGGTPKVFRYFFSYPASRLYGAIHGIELPFVFGTLSSVPGYVPDATASALSEAMNASWARFAAAGDPNGPGLTSWPAYDSAKDRTLVWDSPPGPADGIRTANCNFWDTLQGLISP
jgi:para-nitrobenzyl esterase